MSATSGVKESGRLAVDPVAPDLDRDERGHERRDREPEHDRSRAPPLRHFRSRLAKMKEAADSSTVM
jgi:hypothetical protein